MTRLSYPTVAARRFYRESVTTNDGTRSALRLSMKTSRRTLNALRAKYQAANDAWLDACQHCRDNTEELYQAREAAALALAQAGGFGSNPVDSLNR